ncbi:hypothetical protein MA16_Dca017208 [Dendrobium catenatum]|uniref:Uncharacterized protein n=1 Tax=Dendrobium catenatum TaxID=906689 RepID=A0A2I0W2Q0_9ASPA|nr:hypothetical protein MA16_Dca017208 [Dendrobium catenatum]
MGFQTKDGRALQSWLLQRLIDFLLDRMIAWQEDGYIGQNPLRTAEDFLKKPSNTADTRTDQDTQDQSRMVPNSTQIVSKENGNCFKIAIENIFNILASLREEDNNLNQKSEENVAEADLVIEEGEPIETHYVEAKGMDFGPEKCC